MKSDDIDLEHPIIAIYDVDGDLALTAIESMSNWEIIEVLQGMIEILKKQESETWGLSN